jgi:serine/threonine protein phosphatase PrpC
MIRAYSFSAAGGHAVNEDAFVLQPLRNGAAWLAALADGQGGRSGGRRAAQRACETAIREALALPENNRGDADSWADMLGQADAAVAADREAGFATLVGLCVEENRVVGASCGDSAALAVGSGGLMRVLTAHQFKNPPVGSGGADFVPFELELTAPWRVLLMSDGVWKYATWERVCDRAARLGGEELIAELQGAARLKNTGEFQDDFTVVLLESE